MDPRSMPRKGLSAPRGLRRRTLLVALVGVTTLSMATALAPAAYAHVPKSKTAVVVEVVNRAPFGTMLATVGGASLYTSPAPCTAGCLVIWPPLLMPKGKKIPAGMTGLGTVELKHFGKQVTYHGKPLYTFYADHGGDATGNGVGGFMVATTP